MSQLILGFGDSRRKNGDFGMISLCLKIVILEIKCIVSTISGFKLFKFGYFS